MVKLIQKTVYFYEEDVPKWESVSKKTQWLHNALTIEFKDFHPVVELSKEKIKDRFKPIKEEPYKTYFKKGKK